MMQKQILKRYGALLSAILILLITSFQTIILSTNLNDGRYIYGLDDAYIHMSIASNFAEHGVWGLTQYEYTSATSSPLWTGLLALIYSVSGVHDLTPLLVNLAFAVLLLIVADRILYKHHVLLIYRFIVLLVLIIVLPLNTLIMIGMEHILHALLALAFIDFASEYIGKDEKAFLSRQTGYLLILGMLLGSIRYEGLFIVAFICLLFIIRRHFIHAIILGVISILPIVVYGIIAINHGWEFLPTSLMLKNNTSINISQLASLNDFRRFFLDDTWTIFTDAHMMFVPIVATLLVYLLRYERIRTFWDTRLITLITVIVITIINIRMVSFGHDGAFARYEAYLIVLWLVFVVATLSEFLPHRFQQEHIVRYAVISLTIALVTQGIWQRYLFLAYQRPIVTATENIYQQQVQMAQFLQTYYNNGTIGANDIGAITYFTDIHLVDLYGLGTIDVARAKTDHEYSTNTIRQIVNDTRVQIAIIYETWFTDYGGLPEEWVWVGQWEVTNNIILGYHQVTFYAINPDGAETLAENLRAYSPQLPNSIIERGEYLD